MRIVDWGMHIYDVAMQKVLGLKIMHTYNKNPDDFIVKMNRRHFHLDQEGLQRMFDTSPFEVVGREAVDRVARRRIRYHAFLAGVCTLLTMLPLSWITWPLLIVDIIYFQMQVFVVSQELYILYKRKADYDNAHFNYETLAVVAVRMDGTLIKHQVSKNAKRGIGWAGRWAAGQGVKVFRVSIKNIIRQVFKWLGIGVTKNSIEMTMAYLLSFVCASIGGFISFWMFLPMGRRLRKELAGDNDD